MQEGHSLPLCKDARALSKHNLRVNINDQYNHTGQQWAGNQIQNTWVQLVHWSECLSDLTPAGAEAHVCACLDYFNMHESPWMEKYIFSFSISIPGEMTAENGERYRPIVQIIAWISQIETAWISRIQHFTMSPHDREKLRVLQTVNVNISQANKTQENSFDENS